MSAREPGPLPYLHCARAPVMRASHSCQVKCSSLGSSSRHGSEFCEMLSSCNREGRRSPCVRLVAQGWGLAAVSGSGGGCYLVQKLLLGQVSFHPSRPISFREREEEITPSSGPGLPPLQLCASSHFGTCQALGESGKPRALAPPNQTR